LYISKLNNTKKYRKPCIDDDYRSNNKSLYSLRNFPRLVLLQNTKVQKSVSFNIVFDLLGGKFKICLFNQALTNQAFPKNK